MKTKPPSTEEWLRKMYCGTHIQWNITQPGKGQIVSFAETWTTKRLSQSEVSQKEKTKDGILMHDIWNLEEMIWMNLFAKQK